MNLGLNPISYYLCEFMSVSSFANGRDSGIMGFS